MPRQVSRCNRRARRRGRRPARLPKILWSSSFAPLRGREDMPVRLPRQSRLGIRGDRRAGLLMTRGPPSFRRIAKSDAPPAPFAHRTVTVEHPIDMGRIRGTPVETRGDKMNAKRSPLALRRRARRLLSLAAAACPCHADLRERRWRFLRSRWARRARRRFMHCPRCHAESRDGAKFCEDCGSRLAVRCSSCGSEVSVGKRFCGTCGHPIEHGPTEPRLAARIALDGEHKLVTVLFCDIVNSTGLAERLGAEQMHTLLNRFFERALSEVHRYEGTINQFLGDGFMALFGAPVAHEDHARRAVLAAFGIQQAIGERAEVKAVNGEALTLRMGLNTGPVVAGTIGDQLRTDYTAVGDTTNLAARLQQLAEPGTILVSDTTARLVTGDVEMDALGAFQIKGKTDSIQGYRVTAIRPRRSSRHGFEHRNLSAFVGRDRGLRTLHELLEIGRAHV